MVRSKMILIVEDDDLARRALQSLFVARGFEASAVPSAEDALHTLESPAADQPKMVLIDIDLPGMSGVDLLQRLQREYPDLECTLMSANTDEAGNPRTRPVNPVPFFPKPIDLNRLFTLLRAAPDQTA